MLDRPAVIEHSPPLVILPNRADFVACHWCGVCKAPPGALAFCVRNIRHGASGTRLRWESYVLIGPEKLQLVPLWEPLSHIVQYCSVFHGFDHVVLWSHWRSSQPHSLSAINSSVINLTARPVLVRALSYCLNVECDLHLGPEPDQTAPCSTSSRIGHSADRVIPWWMARPSGKEKAGTRERERSPVHPWPNCR